MQLADDEETNAFEIGVDFCACAVVDLRPRSLGNRFALTGDESNPRFVDSRRN
jgi:hypothetical protein